MRNPGLKTFSTIVLLALGYFVSGRLGLLLPAVGAHITFLWLPSGIAVAALLRWGFGCWPGIALGAFAVNFSTDAGWQTALGIAVGNTLGPALAAWTLRRIGFHPAFDRKRDILLLAAAAALGMLVSASVGVAVLSLAAPLPVSRLAAWLIWWAGDLVGVIVGAPLVLTFTRAEARVILRRRAEFLSWVGATGLMTWIVFIAFPAPGHPLAHAFVSLPFLAWAALRFGAAGTSLAIVAVSAGAAYGTARGFGPFHRMNAIEETQMLWIFMATSAVLGWLIAALHAAQVRATGVLRVFERALSDVSLGVLLAGVDRRMTYVNQGFVRLTGYTGAEMLGQGCEMLQGPDTDRETAEKLRAAMHGDGCFEGEILNYRKDGTTFWNALHISPVHDEHGTMSGYIGIQRDVTGRRQTEAALRHSEEHLRTIIELEPECVKLISPEGRLIEMNPAGLAMLEADSLEAVRGSLMTDLIVPEDRATFMELHSRAMQGTGGRCEFAIMGLKGTRRWLETHAVPYRDAGREIVGVLGITRDITERRQAALEREQLDRKMLEAQKLESLGVLAGGIAHDFNNLLTSILGNASIAAIELPPDSSVQDCIGQITEASLRAADLCKQMLAYSGRGRFVIEKLDLGQLVEQTAQMLQISISKKAVLRFRLEKALPPVEADATQIRQVIMNLVINASEAIGDRSGVISLCTGLTRVDRDYLRGTHLDPALPEGDYVFIEISDSGSGMSPETLERIFDPFFTTKFTGRGLGLAAVLGIVRGHRGALKVYSEQGRGTTFKLLFPAVAGASENGAQPPAPVAGWRGEGTVLVVDDEESMRITLARMMTMLGFDPVSVRDGREAVEMFRADPSRFAFVLLDLTMPHMDGEEAFTELRRMSPDVRVVLMSGFNAQEALMRFSGKGLSSFLQKPFTVATLRSVLQSVLG